MNLTTKQAEAIEAVRRIMCENFDSFIVSYRITDENLRSSIMHDWHGDITDVIGLAVITQDRLLRKCNEATRLS